ncbi:protein kinase [Luteolibacter sp. SL250]|uniref:serine/threonine-protein kinase n=1 Tax=Luteolibacter sp. SL250 TaxID=2995170 RepID=UPI00226E94ED|nr:serine/threonine-protein kinase [Luteolibacter sp. SL250]WAC20011.1 protein kinase [Luteolibacter sp. SL250]
MRQEDSILSGLDPAGLFDLGGGSIPATDGGASPWEPPTPAHLAALFPRWEILGLLGRGGMGAVYHARQPDLDREIAIKLLPIESSADEAFVQRFQREARTLAKLRHPNIVALHEFGTTPEGHPFFVMEYVDGSTLAEKIGSLTVPEALEIVRQACDALSHAHSLGIVHRDIKPSNILLDTAGHIKIADFGLAKWDQQHEAAMTLSRTGGFMGTAEYAAPEQVKDAAHADHRADIYSIGVLFYEMLTGERPRGVFRPPSAKSGSDPRLDPMVLRALQENPGERYQAAAELREELNRLHRRSHPLLLVTAGLCVLLTAAVAFLLLKDRFAPRHEPEKLAVASPPVAEAPAPPPLVPEPAISAAPETTPPAPEPAPPVPTPEPVTAPAAPQPKVFSFNAVDPRFYPPATFLDAGWKSCTLTAQGGAVLTQGGKLLLWDARWKTPREVTPPETIIQLSSTTDQALALGESGTLYRLGDADTPETLGGPPISLLGTCPDNKILPVILKSGELYLLPLTPKYPPVTLTAPPDVTALCLTYSGKVHLLDKGGNLHLATREKTEVIRTDIAAIAAGDQHVALLSKTGAVEILDGNPAPTDLGKILHITAARNTTIAVQEDGRAVIFNSTGGKAQRFRLESGTAPVTTSPAGLLIAR